MITLSGGDLGGTIYENSAAVGDIITIDNYKYLVASDGQAVFIGITNN